MEYAKKSLNLLALSSFSKRMTASMSASAAVTQQLLSSRAPHPKPYRVTNADRSLKKGIVADGLEDLINKVNDSLNVMSASGLVLDEDGTGVDTEDFFTTLPENTVLMVLEKGQMWTPSQNTHWTDQVTKHTPHHRTDVAKLTLDLYKNNPNDFIGCLNVKATLYGVYSMSYEMRCYEAKKMLKEVLRWTAFSMQATGHILLGSSWYMEQLLDEERAEEGLMLHHESRISQLQSFILGRLTY
ncbi:cell death activator CIDE-3 [Stigmatopora nigra]